MDTLTCMHGMPESCQLCGDGWEASARDRRMRQQAHANLMRTSPDYRAAMAQLRRERHTKRWILRIGKARLTLTYTPRKYR